MMKAVLHRWAAVTMKAVLLGRAAVRLRAALDRRAAAHGRAVTQVQARWVVPQGGTQAAEMPVWRPAHGQPEAPV